MNVKPTLYRRIHQSFMLVLLIIVMTAPAVTAASVTVSWDPNVPYPQGYRVFARKIDQAYDYSRPEWEGAAATCTLDHLEGQTEYFFVVRAYDGGIESANSAEAHYVPPEMDNDGDGIPDDWEVRFGLDPRVDDADGDLDHDGVNNRDEFLVGLEPDNPGLGAAPQRPELLFPASDALVARNPLLDVGDFSDVDGDAHIATQWQVEDSITGDILLDVVTNRWLNLLRVPLLLLNGDGAYSWRARFFDSGGRSSAWSARAYFTTQAANDDLDGNGISDDQEGGEVQANVTRSLSSPTITCKPTNLVVASEAIVAEIEQMVLIDPNDLEIDETTPESLPSAMLAYKLALHQPGQRALVTIKLSDPAPAGATWIKYDAVNGWKDYSRYATISADRRSVTVEVKDGGYGDADGVANGIIIDPAGLSIAPIAPTAGSAGRCFISTIHDVKKELPAGDGFWQRIKDSMIRLMGERPH